MKRRLAILGCICFVLAGCDESDSGKVDACDSTFVQQCNADKMSYTMCYQGKVQTVLCDSRMQQVCYNGKCVKETNIPVDNPPVINPPAKTCDDTYVRQCINDVVTYCESSSLKTLACKAGCEGNDCKQVTDVIIQPDCDETYIAHCESNVLVSCLGGSFVRKTCDHGCSQNQCMNETPVQTAGCGDQIIDDGEVCDGANLNGLTCRDLSWANKKNGYSGTPVCNSTCTGIERGTCVESLCGNGRVDREDGEICDFDDKYEYWAGSYTCDDYMNKPGLQWAEGSLPGCSRDCKGLSKGTCKLMPQAIDGIENCQFVSLQQDDEFGIANAQARVLVSDGVLDKDVTGRMVCIKHTDDNTLKAYAWGLKSDAYAISCEGCRENEYLLSADYNYSSLPGGAYDCAFLVNAHGGKNTYYMCSLTGGYPVPMEEVPDSTLVRQIQVKETAVDGEVIAHWHFDTYKKNDEAESVKADDGAFAQDSVIKLSDGTKMKMLSGSSGFPNAGVSSDRWSSNETYVENGKHFVISLKSTGYKNVRIQFKYAGSSVGSRLVAAYVFGSMVQVVGTEQEVLEKNTYADFPVTVLSNADNQSSFAVGVYPYGIEKDNSNATVRLDDIYVLGDRM